MKTTHLILLYCLVTLFWLGTWGQDAAMIVMRAYGANASMHALADIETPAVDWYHLSQWTTGASVFLLGALFLYTRNKPEASQT